MLSNICIIHDPAKVLLQLSTCMQRHIAVPQYLMQSWDTFYTSKTRKGWQHRNLASRNSICSISFRLVNLRAALRNGEITDVQIAIETAISIDEALVSWRETMPPEWEYTVVDSSDSFGGCTHIYPNLWVAEAWKNWRIMRILVNQMIGENEASSNDPNDGRISQTLSVVRQLSMEVCISCSNFMGTPSKFSSRWAFVSAKVVMWTTYMLTAAFPSLGAPTLIEPLYLVAMESLNSPEVRHFAIEQLRCIDTTMGIRHASLLASLACESLMTTDSDYILTDSVAVTSGATSPSQIPAISIM